MMAANRMNPTAHPLTCLAAGRPGTRTATAHSSTLSSHTPTRHDRRDHALAPTRVSSPHGPEVLVESIASHPRDSGRARGGPGREVDGQASTSWYAGGAPAAAIPVVMGEGLKPLTIR